MEPSLKKRRTGGRGLQFLYSALRDEVISYLKLGTELVALTLTCRAFAGIIHSAIQELTVTSSWSRLTHPAHLPRVSVLQINMQKTGHRTLIQVLRALPHLKALKFLGGSELLDVRNIPVHLVAEVTDLNFGHHFVNLYRDVPQSWPAVRTLRSHGRIVNASPEDYPALRELRLYGTRCPRPLGFAPDLKRICLLGYPQSISRSNVQALQQREELGLKPIELFVTLAADIARCGPITFPFCELKSYITDVLVHKPGGIRTLPAPTQILKQLHALSTWPRLRSFHSLGQFAVILEADIFRVEVADPDLHWRLRGAPFWSLHQDWILVRVAQQKLWEVCVGFSFSLDETQD